MKFVDQTTYWLCYLLLLLSVFVAFSFLVVVTLRTASPWLFKKFAPLYKPITGRIVGLPVWITGFASLVVAFFIFNSMFFKFNAYDLDTQRMALHYYWPKKNVVIQKTAYEGFDLGIDRKGAGILIVFANGEKFESVAFDRFTDTNSIILGLRRWKEGVR
jgi:hypothetical protein